jgi:hypothetical protein
MANKIALWVKTIFPFYKSHMANKIALWVKQSFHLTKATWLIKLPYG